MSTIKLAKGRTDLHLFDPVDLTLDTDPASPYYDERIHLPMSEDGVISVMTSGVLEPVLVARVVGRYVVVDGRQRVRWAREAAIRGTPVLVPARVQAVDGPTAAAIGVIANEIRTADNDAVRASKADRLRALGHDTTKMAVIFGRPESYVVALLAVQDNTIEPVKAALRDGRITLTAAHQISRLDAAEQADALAVAESGSVSAVKAAVRTKLGSAHGRPPGKRAIRAYLEDRRATLSVEAINLLDWVLEGGEVP